MQNTFDINTIFRVGFRIGIYYCGRYHGNKWIKREFFCLFSNVFMFSVLLSRRFETTAGKIFIESSVHSFGIAIKPKTWIHPKINQNNLSLRESSDQNIKKEFLYYIIYSEVQVIKKYFSGDKNARFPPLPPSFTDFYRFGQYPKKCKHCLVYA